ncbi:MAG TPA: ThuA domain-containing protein [Rhodothermales bacterium]|nr:ThuA domain-containing protein [Rhodothermales bacterium]
MVASTPIIGKNRARTADVGLRRPPISALLLYGGWKGHSPTDMADFAAEHLLGGFDTVRSSDLDSLNPETLSEVDLLLPIWTFGKLTRKQETALLDAVAGGMGMMALHGNASSFLDSRPHKFMLGGQFVGHPGGNEITYAVTFLGNDPLVEGLDDITITSEQYYLLIDPAVKVLATTIVDGGDLEWLRGVQMPVAWKRTWGNGRVFYCALGHSVDVLENASVSALLKRAVRWATAVSPPHRGGG